VGGNEKKKCRQNVLHSNLSVRIDVLRYIYFISFIHYATDAAQTYKIKHKVKTQSIKNSKNTTQQRNQIQISTV